MNWIARLFKSLRPKRSCWHRQLEDGRAKQCPVCRAESLALANRAKDDLAPEIDAFTDALKAALPGDAERALCKITSEFFGETWSFGFSFKEPIGYSPRGNDLAGSVMTFFANSMKKGHAITNVKFVAKRGPDRGWHVSLRELSMKFGEH